MADFDRLVQRVVDVSKIGARRGTTTEVSIGEAVHRAVLAKLKPGADAKIRRSLRADALVVIAARLCEEGIRRVNLNRAIQVCHVARLFGNDQARTLPINTMECFCRLIKRNTATEEWTIKTKHLEAATALWARVVAGEVPAASVRSEVDTILGKVHRAARAVKPKHPPSLVDVLANATEEQLAAAFLTLRDDNLDAFRRIFSAAKSLAPKRKTDVVDEPITRKLFGPRREAA